jgi:hypothetical protein
MSEALIVSKQRVADHGEVFTPGWLVDAMLDLVKEETERIDSRFLEPACGSGNFLVKILQRKLAAVEVKYSKSDFEKKHYALFALMCIYGVELLQDNIEECRAHLLKIFCDYLRLAPTDELSAAAQFVLSQNIIHGDARKMLDVEGCPITFAEWGYLGKGRFQRRNFSLKSLTLMSSLRQTELFEESGAEHQAELFAQLGSHEVFTPTRTYSPATPTELAMALKQATPQQ